MDEHTEDCTCNDCADNRAAFADWCNNTEARWLEAYKAGKVARLHICNGDCGPLADCGDPRDTSIDIYRLLHEVRP